MWLPLAKLVLVLGIAGASWARSQGFSYLPPPCFTYLPPPPNTATTPNPCLSTSTTSSTSTTPTSTTSSTSTTTTSTTSSTSTTPTSTTSSTSTTPTSTTSSTSTTPTSTTSSTSTTPTSTTSSTSTTPTSTTSSASTTPTSTTSSTSTTPTSTASTTSSTTTSSTSTTPTTTTSRTSTTPHHHHHHHHHNHSSDPLDWLRESVPGEPGRDYPILGWPIVDTSFSCSGRPDGYYADPETRCQAFHICLFDRDTKVLCPNGTIFSQEHFTCRWWKMVDCSTTESFYELNNEIGIVPPDSPYQVRSPRGTASFSVPIVVLPPMSFMLLSPSRLARPIRSLQHR